MKKVDLGFGAVAFEPDSEADRADGIPAAFFDKHSLGPEARNLYQRYLSSMHQWTDAQSGTPEDPPPSSDDTKASESP